MLDWLGCLVMGVFVVRCSLEDARLLFDTLQKASATVAIVVVGGLWAYFRFVAGRTLKRHLEECEVYSNAIRKGGKVRISSPPRSRTSGSRRFSWTARTPASASSRKRPRVSRSRPAHEPWALSHFW